MTKPRYHGLDGLRAIAVTAVVLFHFGIDRLAGGFLGVDVFFVISGFLITSLLLHEYAGTGRIQLGRFYLRRARRLLPALALVVVTSLLACVLFWRDALAEVRADALASTAYATNWWYLIDHKSYAEATGRPSMLQHLWSLAVEEQFYLVWPFVVVGVLGGVALLRRFGRNRSSSSSSAGPVGDAAVLRVGVVAAVGALASTALMAVLAIRSDVPFGADSARVYLGTDTHAMGLMCGAALASVVFVLGRRAPRLPLVVRGAWWSDLLGATALAVLVVVALRSTLWSPMLFRGGFLLVSLASVVVIAAAIRKGSALGMALGAAPLAWIGERSYAIYLWHWPVTVVTRPGIDTTWSTPWVFAFRVAVTLVLAELTYRLLENPIRQGTFVVGLKELVAGTRRRPELTATAVATVLIVVGGALTAAGPTHASQATAPVVAPPTTAAATATRTLTVSQASLRKEAPLPSPSRHATPVVRPTRSAVPKPARSAAPKPVPVRTKVSAFGDSVMVGATPALEDVLPGIRVDAVVARQSQPTFAAVLAALASGTLADTVVIHTGTNGVVRSKDLDDLLDDLGGRRVILVNTHVPRPWQSYDNNVISSVAAKHPNATVVDWNGLANQHAGWFGEDGTHPGQAGCAALAALIAAAVRN